MFFTQKIMYPKIAVSSEKLDYSKIWSADWQGHNDTIWPASQIQWHTWDEDVNRAKQLQHSRQRSTRSFIYTHTFPCYLFLLGGISQQLTRSRVRERLMLPSCAWPLFMHALRVRVKETIGGKGLSAGPSISNLLLHARRCVRQAWR